MASQSFTQFSSSIWQNYDASFARLAANFFAIFQQIIGNDQMAWAASGCDLGQVATLNSDLRVKPENYLQLESNNGSGFGSTFLNKSVGGKQNGRESSSISVPAPQWALKQLFL